MDPPGADAYWNRETSKHGEGYSGKVIKEAKIVCLSDPDDKDNEPLYRGGDKLPEGSSVLAVGTALEDFDLEALKEAQPNVVFVSHPTCILFPCAHVRRRCARTCCSAS